MLQAILKVKSSAAHQSVYLAIDRQGNKRPSWTGSYILHLPLRKEQLGQRCGRSNSPYLNGIHHYRWSGGDNRPVPFLYQQNHFSHQTCPPTLLSDTPPPRSILSINLLSPSDLTSSHHALPQSHLAIVLIQRCLVPG